MTGQRRDRQRRYRERQRAGRVSVTVEVGEPLVEALLADGLLASVDADRREAIAAAVQALLAAFEGVTRHDVDF